jgi:hypothetical protein
LLYRFAQTPAAGAGTTVAITKFPTNKIRIVGASITVDTAVVTDTDSGFRFSLVNGGTCAAGAIGTGTVRMATFLGDSVAATTAAGSTLPLTIQTASTADVLAAAQQLQFVVNTVGTGTATSHGNVMVEYIDL